MNYVIFISGIGFGTMIATALMLWIMSRAAIGKKNIERLNRHHAELLARFDERNGLLKKQNTILADSVYKA